VIPVRRLPGSADEKSTKMDFLEQTVFWFEEWVLSVLADGVVCEHCGCTPYEWRLLKPNLEFEGTSATLTYPATCTCGRRTALRWTLPTLELGLLLLRVWHVELFVARSSRKETKVRPGPSEFVVNSHQEFLRLLDSLRGAAPPAQEHERFGFGMSEATWNDFLRRLGLSPEVGDEKPRGGA
jgi:hypothetical protein